METNENQIVLDMQIVTNYLFKLKEKTGLSFEVIAEKSRQSTSNVKKIFAGNIENPGIKTIAELVYVLGGSMDELLNPTKTKDDLKEFSVAALKEMYEFQAAERNKANEKHIDEMRAHYAQHREDVTENYERLLSNKRELIDSYKEHLMSVQKENKWLKFACACMFVAFAGLCVAELMNPNIGWIRF